MFRLTRRYPMSPLRIARHSLSRSACLLGLAVSLFGCSDGGSSNADAPWNQGVRLLPEAQAPGDPVRGQQILLNGSYMSCGIPLKLWDSPIAGQFVREALGGRGGEVGLDGREGRNAELPHTLNAFTTSEGADVVNQNCLMCHSGKFEGEVIVGMGSATADF